jgi:DNA-binding transcriptional LysR family regulator
MPRRNDLSDIAAFLAVARERNFTRAASQLGVTQSALSHTIRGLEERLGLRLLTRSTRSVSPTEAGERLIHSVGLHFEEIEAGIAALGSLRDRPSGTVRITASDHAIDSLLWPKLQPVLAEYPEIKVELIVDYGFTDIVAERYDAGVRYGEAIAKEMIAVRIGPDAEIGIVGSPSYFDEREPPLNPQDLLVHSCINMRMPTYGGLYAWEFDKEGQSVNVRVEGQLVFNTIQQIRRAALDGFGLAYIPLDLVQRDVDEGRLVRVLADWCEPFTGFHLYYPSRRQASPAFVAVVNALRHRGR